MKPKNIYKSFWITATLAHNSCIESDLDGEHLPKAARTGEDGAMCTPMKDKEGDSSDSDSEGSAVGGAGYKNGDPF